MKLRTLSACLSLVGFTSVAHAAGFSLLEQNNSGLGNAYAGSAAVAENASAMFFNPANLTQLDGFQISTGVSFIRPSFTFKDNGTTTPTALPPFISKGGTGGDAGSWAAVPNLYLSYKLNERVAFGLGLSAPFGLKTEYDPKWMGRYHSRSFDIKTLNINPALAFKVNDSVSLGLGLNIQKIEATYKKATPVVITHPVTGLPVVITSGDAKTRVNNVGYGWNAGLVFHPSEQTRIGLSYRSRIKHQASGTTSVNFLAPNPLTGAIVPMQLQSNAAASVSLPDTFILSGYQRLNDKWEVMADVSWMGWSSLPKLTIVNKDFPASSRETGLELKFKDTWRVAIGANYAFNERWKLKTGFAWDQSPVRDSNFRLASLPDSNRYWLSLGAQYKPSANTTIDLGYAYVIAQKSTVNNNNNNATLYGTLKGSYKANSHILGLQVSHRF